MIKRFCPLDKSKISLTDYKEPDRYRHLIEAISQKPSVVMGSGLSYVAAGFLDGGRTATTRFFDRILGFDEGRELVEVEAGVTLGKLYQFLAEKKMMVPVQPGHPQITIGGCIAGNIFGKNQFRDGLFENCLESLVLYHPKYGTITASRSENQEVFELTVGGLGLTGLIISAKIRLKRVNTMNMEAFNFKVRDFNETFALLEEKANDSDMIYSWNDLSTRNGTGRGFVVSGTFRRQREFTGQGCKYQRLEPGKSYPCIYNSYSLPILNSAYLSYNTVIKPRQTMSLFDFLFPVANKVGYFYMFGARGFIERQMLISKSNISGYMADFMKLFRKHHPVIALVSCKIFRGKRKLLHFVDDGFVLSLDLLGRRAYLPFHEELYAMNLHWGVLDNVLKDSLLTADMAAKEYSGEFESFKARLTRHDPDRHFQSDLSRRLGL